MLCSTQQYAVWSGTLQHVVTSFAGTLEQLTLSEQCTAYSAEFVPTGTANVQLAMQCRQTPHSASPAWHNILHAQMRSAGLASSLFEPCQIGQSSHPNNPELLPDLIRVRIQLGRRLSSCFWRLLPFRCHLSTGNHAWESCRFPRSNMGCQQTQQPRTAQGWMCRSWD